MPMPIMVTNRTQEQLTEYLQIRQKMIMGTATIEEETLYLAGMPAAFNASDLNRIGDAILWIQSELYNIRGVTVVVNVRNDYSYTDIPTAQEMSDLIDAINILRAEVFVPLPATPSSMNNLTISNANHIENILRFVNVQLHIVS